jgi:Na+-transporting NADH:ubiquinone oxidoreductase subunit C
MAIDTEKNSYTVIFAVVMVIIVGAILAGLASGLKPLVKANERYEKQQNILYAMGVNNNEGANDVEFIPTEVVEDEFKKSYQITKLNFRILYYSIKIRK